MIVDAAVRRPPLGRTFFPLAVLAVVVGVSSAVWVPFLSLFLSAAVRASPIEITTFLLLTPIAGVVWSSVVGRLSDRWGTHRPLLLATSITGLLGMGLTALVRDYWSLLALTVTLTASSSALYPQIFAYARQVLADGGGRAAFGISALRMMFSLAWVVGPPGATVLLTIGGFRCVFGVSAGLYAVAVVVCMRWLADPVPPRVTEATDEAMPINADVPVAAVTSPRSMLLAVLAFIVVQCPLTLGLQALPLVVSNELRSGVGDAGLVLGLCAAVEIPLMLGLGALALRIQLRTLVLGGVACGAAYYVFATAATDVWMLAVAQVANAVFIAAVTGLGIAYMQDLLPGEPGRATTLFTNAYTVGAMLAGPLLGLAQQVGYRLAFGICAGLCFVGLLALLPIRPVVANRSI